MGEIVTVSNDGLNKGTTDQNRGNTTGGSGNSTSTTNTSTSPTGGTSERTGGTSERTGGTSERNEEKEIVSGLAILTDEEREKYKTADEEEKKRLLRNAKRRQQYAEQKKQNGQNVKPRKVNKRTKATQETVVDTTTLNVVVASLSSVIASRPNCEHWLLSENEINSITQPLAKMIGESEALNKLTEYSNEIALVTACATVFLPRVFVSVQKAQEVKKLERTGQHTNTIPDNINKSTGDNGKKKTGNSKSDRGNVEKPTTNGTNNVPDVPFYGLPIC